MNSNQYDDADISFAYAHSLPPDPFKAFRHCRSLDFLSSCFSIPRVSGFDHLTHLRLSRACSSLDSLELANLPQLRAVDASLLQNLRSVTVDNCPNLRALDFASCTNLRELSGALTQLEYLSVGGCKLRTCSPMPALLYLDADGPYNTFDFADSSALEFLAVGYGCSTAVRLSALTLAFPQLRTFERSHRSFDFDALTPGARLEFVVLNSCDSVTDSGSVMDRFFVVTDNKPNHDFPGYGAPYRYVEAQRLLYGKWGTPLVDQLPAKVAEKPVFYKPEGCGSVEQFIRGALFGSAVMDMVGLGVEFLPKPIAQVYLANPVSINWSHPRSTTHTVRFVRGTATDDTSQNVLIMRSLFKSNSSNAPFEPDGKKKFMAGNVRVDLNDFGMRLIDWMEYGHSEHNQHGGMGIGRTVYSVLSHPMFLIDPIGVSREVWEESGRRIAANGAVMRVASCGCLCYWDEETVIQVATKTALITHFDPRCVFSAVAISLLVARILQQHAGLISSFDIDQTIETAIRKVEGAEKYRDEILRYSRYEKIEDLELSSPMSIGYTLKAYGSAVWALRYCNSFAEALEKVVREGGDSDTNGAVVGAVIGAKYGFSGIPKELIEYMLDFSWFNREVKSFLSLMSD